MFVRVPIRMREPARFFLLKPCRAVAAGQGVAVKGYCRNKSKKRSFTMENYNMSKSTVGWSSSPFDGAKVQHI